MSSVSRSNVRSHTGSRESEAVGADREEAGAQGAWFMERPDHLTIHVQESTTRSVKVHFATGCKCLEIMLATQSLFLTFNPIFLSSSVQILTEECFVFFFEVVVL